jgi:hypothetical protein
VLNGARVAHPAAVFPAGAADVTISSVVTAVCSALGAVLLALVALYWRRLPLPRPARPPSRRPSRPASPARPSRRPSHPARPARPNRGHPALPKRRNQRLRHVDRRRPGLPRRPARPGRPLTFTFVRANHQHADFPPPVSAASGLAALACFPRQPGANRANQPRGYPQGVSDTAGAHDLGSSGPHMNPVDP